MEKNYTANPTSKAETPAKRQSSQGVTMETKILLAKIGLLICIIILIVARSIGH